MERKNLEVERNKIRPKKLVSKTKKRRQETVSLELLAINTENLHVLRVCFPEHLFNFTEFHQRRK